MPRQRKRALQAPPPSGLNAAELSFGRCFVEHPSVSRPHRIVVLSDVHYASAAEQARGDDYERRGISNPLARLALRLFRDWIWLRHPLRQNHLLDQFLDKAGTPDLCVANGDYTCDSGFIGTADDAAAASVRECLGRLQGRFGQRFQATLGDHEIGKRTMAGNAGHMALASYERATGELGIPPLWQRDLGGWTLLGVCSTLIGLPHFEADALPPEVPRWRELRAQHLDAVRAALRALPGDGRLILFCHDPTALPFLAAEPEMQRRLPQLERTVIGHLHTRVVLWKAQLLCGMPEIRFLGHTARKLSRALREARAWRPFKVLLCPSLAGIELLKDGGFLEAELPEQGAARFHLVRVRR